MNLLTQKNLKALAVCALACVACVSSASQPIEHHIQRGDVSLVYETEGKGDVVILLSGGPGVTPESVRYPFEEIARDHEAVLLNQRGTGKSKLPVVDSKHVSLPIFIDDIDAVRQDLHADKITLIGHSWGGMLAMAYAGAHPDRVSHLILMDSGGVNLSFAPVFQDNINMRLMPEDIAIRKLSDKEGMYSPLGGYHYLESILPGYFYSRAAALKFRDTLKPDDFNPKLQMLLFGFDISKSIVNYHGPVDIVQGRQDPIDASTVQLNMKYLPQAKVHWVERAGHIPWLENEGGFNAAFEAALANQSGSEK